MYDVVVIPTDGSDASAAAVEQGVAIAAEYGSTAHLLYVVDVGTEMSASAVGTIADELTETLEREADDALAAAASRAEDAGVEFERATLEGVPHEAIAEYADERDADLVAVGATGRSGLREHLLGSTADRVARSVDASVLLARR